MRSDSLTHQLPEGVGELDRLGARKRRDDSSFGRPDQRYVHIDPSRESLSGYQGQASFSYTSPRGPFATIRGQPEDVDTTVQESMRLVKGTTSLVLLSSGEPDELYVAAGFEHERLEVVVGVIVTA